MRELLCDGDGYTVEGFAAQFNAKRTTVGGWLNGDVEPSAGHLRAISDHFRVSVDWLLGLPNAPKHRGQQRTDASLAQDAAEYIDRLIVGKLRPVGKPMEPFWRLFVSHWRADAQGALEQAAERAVQALRDAGHGLDAFEDQARAKLRERGSNLIDPIWPAAGQSSAERKVRQARYERQVSRLVQELVRIAREAEFARRINASGAALKYVPPKQKSPAG